MKLLINRQALSDALKLVGGAVVTRTPKPVLTCVKLVAGDKLLTLMATDMERAISTTLAQVDVEEAGTVLIPHAKLEEILGLLHDDTITLSGNGDHTVTVKASSGTFRIFSFDPDEFPPVVITETPGALRLDAATLSGLLDQVAIAAAHEQTRYAINGVLFEATTKQLTLVGTDGHRLAKASIAATGGQGTAVVPISSVSMIRRAIKGKELTACLAWNDKTFTLHVLLGEVVTISLRVQLLEGSFPAWQDVIPKDPTRTLSVDSEAFADALRQAASMASAESRGVKMALSAKGVVFSARTCDVGEATVETAGTLTGEPIEIAFNPAYVLDFCKAAPAGEITVELSEPNKPMLFRGGEKYLYVVMPVNLE